MKITNETIFRCEFCNKPMFNKGAMSLHERMCKKNPKNKHKCFEYCNHLIKESEYGEVSFHCTKLDKELYSYKLERYESNQKRINNLERMPLNCSSYEIESGHDDFNV